MVRGLQQGAAGALQVGGGPGGALTSVGFGTVFVCVDGGAGQVFRCVCCV